MNSIHCQDKIQKKAYAYHNCSVVKQGNVS